MSPSTLELHRKNGATLLKALAEITQTRAAELADLSESTVSRMQQPKGEDNRSELDRALAVISACNLTLTPRTYRAVDPEELRALQVLARARLGDAAPSGFGGL
jgi:cytosine/adenosine deaminase-related metal-dependent hydrolase